MLIHIIFPFSDTPWGGGNQFLKALKQLLLERGLYAENPEEADAFLFNSHHWVDTVCAYKWKYPRKIFVHRVDGPVSLYRGEGMEIDREIFHFNDMLADATVFQSEFSKEALFDLGMHKNRFEMTAMNAPNPKIFYPAKDQVAIESRKIKLIATSWSSNWNKGFDVYQWLDQNLDFNRYEMTFVGNAPIKFSNIHHLSPLKSADLAGVLREHDIFITASRKDPCSNSLLEALHCGLPAIALKDGGHPEIVGKGGCLFQTAEEIPSLLDKVVHDYAVYKQAIDLPSIDSTTTQYANFIQKVVEDGQYQAKTIGFLKYSTVILSMFLRKVIRKLKSMLKKG